jgi:cytochrome c biogenesis protein CcdA
VVVWWQRKRLTSKPRSTPIARTGAGFTLGAGITLIELPTAFPYFAAIAAIVASGVSIGEQAILLTLFNVAFILPVLGVLGVLMAFGARSDRALGAARDWLQRNWPIVVAVLGLIVGAAILGLGIRGLITR